MLTKQDFLVTTFLPSYFQTHAPVPTSTPTPSPTPGWSPAPVYKVYKVGQEGGYEGRSFKVLRVCSKGINNKITVKD